MKLTKTMLLAVAVCSAMVAAASPAVAGADAINGRIAFTRYDVETDHGSTFTINPDGSGEAQVGTGDVSVCESWSPDSTKVLACAWFEGEGARPATANADGSDFTVLDAYPGVYQSLACYAWSVDGTRFLCSSVDDVTPNDGLYTVRSSDGGGLSQVTFPPDGHADLDQVYSPDGSRILFIRLDRTDPREPGTLFSVKTDGSDLIQLSPSTLFAIDSFASWSPDGSEVAFAAVWKTGHGRGTALYVVNADGSALRQVTPAGLGAVSAKWSPDGRLIAFTNKLRADAQIWVIRPDGTSLRQVTSGSGGVTSQEPVWSPDGTRLLFLQVSKHGEQLRTVRVDGTGSLRLADIPDGTGPSYAWGTAPTP
jgi:Tol biopolymer transport system component